MLKKVVGYALTNKDGKYLVFNQVGDSEIEIYTSEHANDATLFDSHSNAHDEGYGVRFDTNEWNYLYNKKDVPTKIVKVKKFIEVEDIGLIDKNK